MVPVKSCSALGFRGKQYCKGRSTRNRIQASSIGNSAAAGDLGTGDGCSFSGAKPCLAAAHVWARVGESECDAWMGAQGWLSEEHPPCLGSYGIAVVVPRHLPPFTAQITLTDCPVALQRTGLHVILLPKASGAGRAGNGILETKGSDPTISPSRPAQPFLPTASSPPFFAFPTPLMLSVRPPASIQLKQGKCRLDTRRTPSL